MSDKYSIKITLFECHLKDLHKHLDKIKNPINFIKLAEDFNEHLNCLIKSKEKSINLLKELKQFNKNKTYVNQLLIELKN